MMVKEYKTTARSVVRRIIGAGRRCLMASAAGLGITLAPAGVLAQGMGLQDTAGILPQAEQAQPVPEEVDQAPRTTWKSSRYGAVKAKDSEPLEGEIRPFGDQLFEGGFRGVRSDGLNPDYRIVPGDQVTIRVWGAVEIEKVQPVDAQGNLFLPGIGPVKVQGLSHSQLNSRVRGAVESVYPEKVHVYTNLQGVQPVAVFVTGYVENPGRYAGTPTDSLLYFLHQAGGIDPELGSYRQIRLLRDDKVIAEADLYDFLLSGNLPRIQLQDGDTILVTERGPAVTVTGDVKRAYQYELDPEQMNGAALLDMARLTSDVSHVLLRGSRTQGPVSAYFPIEDFAEQPLKSGDEVLFSADLRDETIVVQLEGSYYGPSRYALPRDAHLHELLDSVAVPRELTDVNSVSIRRVSVAERQKAALMESLRRLETTYLGAPSATPDEAKVRVQEAELISKFVERARQIDPTGRLVVARNDRIADIRLQDGDVITLPETSESVQISGEVLVPQSVVYKSGVTVQDYIDGSGGFTQHADPERILVVRRNGEVREAEQVALRPGDEILVLPEVPTKNLQLATSMTQILYQIAIAAKVALDL